MRLHNTLTRKTDDFKPLKPNHATIYSCGPTVYDHIHIGNLRAFIAADTLRRGLQAQNYAVKHVMNFTDVDDKTIQRSAQTYPDDSPEVALKQLTSHYADIFLKDMQAIGNDVSALTFVKATESLPAMQTLITKLHKAGFAYIADDGVYFSISKYRAAGKKYGQLLELSANNTSEARIDNDEYDKESVHDFALWKLQKPGEPAWDFELDGHKLLGRPGWHIECSAMSAGALGQPFDIHTGGIDLIFPHHENEIAQSTATDAHYANYFVHNEHLLVDGRKMAKSANNFFTLQDVREKGFDPLAFRVMALQAHYRNPLNFSWDNLTAAQNRLTNLRAMAVRHWQPVQSSPVDEELLKTVQSEILTAFKNDLDTPTALASLSRLEEQVNTHGLKGDVLADFRDLLEWLDDIFGFDLTHQTTLNSDERQLLNDRQAARDSKNWEEADRLRDELAKQGVIIRDDPSGQVWSRK